MNEKEYLTECRAGQHPLICILTTAPKWDDECSVVRWCPVCGAVVVDMEYDGRTYSGRISAMKIPKITQEEVCR